MRNLLNTANAEIERIKIKVEFDPDTGMFRRKWLNGDKGDWTKGSKRSNGYRAICVDRKSMLAHRVAYALYYGEFPDGLIDHINGDRSDNRISNLRVVDHAENMKNRPVIYNRKKKFKGCYFDKDKNKWRAAARIENKVYLLGNFNDEESAHQAYIEFIKLRESI